MSSSEAASEGYKSCSQGVPKININLKILMESPIETDDKKIQPHSHIHNSQFVLFRKYYMYKGIGKKNADDFIEEEMDFFRGTS